MSDISPDQPAEIGTPITRQWLRNSAISLFASKVIASIAVLVTGVLILRYLDPADYGFYQVAISISSFFALALGLGFSPVVTRFVPELLERGATRSAARFLIAVIAIRLSLMAVAVPVGFIFFDSIGELFGLENIGENRPLLVLGIVLGVYLGTATGPVVLGSYARQVEIGITSVLSALFRIVAVVLAVVLDQGLTGVLVAVASVELSMMLIYFFRSGIVVHSRTRFHDEKEQSIRISARALRYAVPHWVITGLSFFEGRFGMIFVVSNALGTAAAGNYAFVFVAMQFGSILNPVYTLNSLIHNVIVRRSVHVSQTELLARGQRMFLTLTVYTAVPVAVYATIMRAPLSQLFGFEQAGTGWLFLWAGIFFITNSAKLAYGNIFSQLEVPTYKLLIGLVNVAGIGVAIAVVKPYGIVGVASVAAASSSLSLLLQHVAIKYRLKIPVGIYPVMLMKVLFINVLAGLSSYAVVGVGESFIAIASATSALFIIVYGAATVIAKPFSSEDTVLLTSIFPSLSKLRIKLGKT